MAKVAAIRSGKNKTPDGDQNPNTSGGSESTERLVVHFNGMADLAQLLPDEMAVCSRSAFASRVIGKTAATPPRGFRRHYDEPLIPRLVLAGQT